MSSGGLPSCAGQLRRTISRLPPIPPDAITIAPASISCGVRRVFIDEPDAGHPLGVAQQPLRAQPEAHPER